MLVDRETFPGILTWIRESPTLALDTETTGLNPYWSNDRTGHFSAVEPDHVIGISLSDGYDNSAYLSFRHGIPKNIEPNETNLVAYDPDNLPPYMLRDLVATLNERIAEKKLDLLFWNAKFDLHMMANEGLDVPLSGQLFDVMIGAHLVNENEPSFGLKEYCDRYGIGVGSLDEEELRDVMRLSLGITTTDKTWKGQLWRLPAADVARYAESDTVLTFQAARMVHQLLGEMGIERLYRDYCDYLLLIWRMERRGVRLNRDLMLEHGRHFGPMLRDTYDAIMNEVKEIQGHTYAPQKEPKIGKRGLPIGVKKPEQFNPGSSTQIIALTEWEKTDVRYIEELEDGAPYRELGTLLLDYRVLSKVQGTYYDAYLELIDRDNILRPNYNLHGTVNGRMSCSRPNLQNVPRFTDRRPVKDVFIPRDGYTLVEMDYQQAELRIAAHYAEEDLLREIFLTGRDPHGETAERMGVPRFIGKTLNFAVIYGAGVNGVMKTLKCSEEDARDYLNGYHGLYPNFRKLSTYLTQFAEREGYIRMETGRYRRFDTYKRYEWEIKPHKAMNSLIQGTASEMLRVAMLNADRAIRASGIDAHMLLQVHDSLMLECAPNDVPKLIEILRECMTDFAFSPPPDIDVKVGASWARMEKYAA